MEGEIWILGGMLGIRWKFRWQISDFWILGRNADYVDGADRQG
jgi:hypothetical protein